jgi:hypothetical protein
MVVSGFFFSFRQCVYATIEGASSPEWKILLPLSGGNWRRGGKRATYFHPLRNLGFI